MTEYERKFIVNPFLKENCETESKRWYNLFDKPFELLQRFNYELHYLLGWIKILKRPINKRCSRRPLNYSYLYFFRYRFSEKIANLLISCGKSDTAKTFNHIRWMQEEIGYAISYYREHFTVIQLNKDVIRPFIYMYVRLVFLYSSAFVDIMQKEPDKECEFENLCNWIKYPKRWEVRYRSFIRENLDKLK